jgi:ELWxxDGT repeat protein
VGTGPDAVVPPHPGHTPTSTLGAALVADINPGSPGSNPGWLTNVFGTLFFAAQGPGQGLLGVGGGTELWKSDGTAAGTSLVKDINPGSISSNPMDLTRVGTTVFFSANDGIHGRELWKSDGTAAGTRMVEDIGVGDSDSGPANLTNFNGKLFFTDTDPLHGTELWKSDGTAAGTVMVKDINPGPGDSDPTELTVAGGKLYFLADDGNGPTLWTSDGTPGGTKRIGATFNIDDLTAANGRLFFRTSFNGGYYVQSSLWTSDGTAAGTIDLYDFPPGGILIENFTAFNGALFFDDGFSLWKSNGTAAGTSLVADLPGLGADPVGLTPVGSTLYFGYMDDGDFHWHLGKSDGTAAGTVDVKQLNNDGPPDEFTGVTGGFTPNTGRLYFTEDDGSHGDELWTSDGTAANTVMLRDINPGSGSSSPSDLRLGGLFGGALYFAADDGQHGVELWVAENFTPPKVTHVPDQVSAEGAKVALPIHALNGPLTYSATGLPAGLSIDSGTGLISGRVGNRDAVGSPYSVTVTVVDGALFSDSTTFNWVVTDPTIPTLSNPVLEVSIAGQPASLQLTAKDADGDPLTVSAHNLPPGLSINGSTGLISGTIAGNAAGIYLTVVSVSDGTNTSGVSFLWVVHANTPPVVSNPGPQNSNEGNAISLAVSASDADGDPLTYSASGLPQGLSINGSTGVISGTVGNQAAGSYTVTVSVSDGLTTAGATFTWTVNDITPPVLTNPGPQTSNEGNTIGLVLSASDADGDPLTFSAANLPPGLSINSGTGKISGTLANQAAGTYQVTVSASDGFNTTSLTFTWTVNDITPPVLVNPGNQANTLGDVVTLAVSAGDADGDPLTYFAGNLPPGLSIDGGTGVISGTVTAPTVLGSPYLVTVFASDGQNTGSVSFLWTFNGVAPGS